MGHLSHDKGERAGLGRLVEVMSFNNRTTTRVPHGMTASFLYESTLMG